MAGAFGTIVGAAWVVVREVGWWLSAGFGLLRRHPVRTLLWSVLAVVSVAWEWWWLTAGLLLPLVGFGLWARIGPVSFQLRVADPLWRRGHARWLRKRWAQVMEACGLARRMPGTAGEVGRQSPLLRRLRWIDGQLVATPGLLVGQTIDDYEAAADRLRVSLDANRVRVIANQSLTGCQLVWSFGDPLARRFDAMVPTPLTSFALPAVSLDAVTLGRTEDGGKWRLPIGVSTLVAGSSGSGKASLIWGLVFGLAPHIRTGLVQVHGVDLKGGMEFAMGRALFTRYAQQADAAVVMLEDAATAMQARAARLAGIVRQHTPSLAEPLVVVLVDELAALIAYLPDRDLTKRAEAALSLLLSQGRAVGFFVFAFLQDPRKETVKMRHLFGQSLGLRLRDREEVAMVLGDGAVQAGAWCQKISRSTPGVGFVLGEDGRPVRVRAGYVSDAMIRDCAARFPAARQHPGDRLFALFAVGVAVGLRKGELAGLRWEDVDLDQGLVHVRQTIQRVYGVGMVTGPPKSARSRRDVPLPVYAVQALKEHRTRQLEERLAMGRYWIDSGLVFTTTIGTGLDPRNLTRVLDELIAAAGVRRIRFHDLRHTCASLLLAQGVPARW